MSHVVINLNADISDYFEEVVGGAMRARNVDVTPAASSYVVGLLCEYAHPSAASERTFDEPLTFALRDALEANGKERFKRLRMLGDHVLYALGFFGGHLEMRGVAKSYVVGVGTTAYTEAASMLKLNPKHTDAGHDVLRELARKFKPVADVLADVAEGTLACGAKDERSVVKMYERWLKTGSTRLAEELGAQGILPTRGSGGLH